MSGTPLLILGAGTFAIETLEAAELAGGFRPLGFVVSDTAAVPALHAGLPVYHSDAIPAECRGARMIGGIVTNRRRPFIEGLEARGWQFTSVVHPRAIVSPRAVIEEGAFVGAGAIVASHAHIGRHVLLNRGSNIGHDVRLHPFVTVSPGATLAGAVQVGAGAYIGVGAAIRDHLSIGAGAVIAAGAVVVKPVDSNVMVAGCPAVVMKRGVDGL
jgi:sugar O-acyltransferase (sialic acid O-acetyltransferase NeuD family)